MTASVATAVPPERTSASSGLAVSDVRCAIYEIPTDQPEADGTLAWSSTTMVLVELSAAGTVGTGWTYAGGGCRDVVDKVLKRVVAGADPMHVPGLHEAMVRACRNLGRPGVVSCAISAVDTALWDLKARLLDCPLSRLFGRCASDVAIYGSGGFTTYSDETAAKQLEHWTADLGARAVKIKIGESFGRCADRDLQRVAFARQVVGDDAELFVDANGGYRAKQAISAGRRFLGDYGVSWYEEPVPSDDLRGLRQVRDALDLDVAAGEYGYDEPYFARMIDAGAVDCLQIDVTRCGGYTSWLRAAGMAFSHGLQISAHCAPALHVQVAVAVPNARHIEYFHDHSRIEGMLFDGALVPSEGMLVPDDSVPGHGYILRVADAERYRVQ